MDAPKKIHVRWGKSGDTRVTYMEERFWPPDNEAEYILAAEHDRLMAEKTAEIERLREALRPFAEFPDPRNPNARHDDNPVWGRNGVTLTVGDFAKARAALGGDNG